MFLHGAIVGGKLLISLETFGSGISCFRFYPAYNI